MSETIGSRISELLKQQNMTQRELAEEIGVREVSVSRYVRGERIPKSTVLQKIAKTLHTTADYLIGSENDQDPELEYYRVLRIIARHSNEWTGKQKGEIVRALFIDDFIVT
jgi:transcriptional regulator with XRE-family HTH domain